MDNLSDSETRIGELVQHYSLPPEDIGKARAGFNTLLFGLQGRISPDTYMTREEICSRAMDEAMGNAKKRTKRIMCMRPPQVFISPEDLHTLQSSPNTLFFMNHQKPLDIPYACQTFLEQLGTHAETHFVMKASLHRIFERGGGILLKRNKDIQQEKQTGKEDTRDHVLALKELPDFLGEFTEQPQRNVAIYSQGTRKPEEEAFEFDKPVMRAVSQHVRATREAQHVIMGFDYRPREAVRVHMKVLEEGQKEKELGDTINQFLGSIRDGDRIS